MLNGNTTGEIKGLNYNNLNKYINQIARNVSLDSERKVSFDLQEIQKIKSEIDDIIDEIIDYAFVNIL
tara:strand:- start:3693 stop:3896 length:204 start_codon:yes stop_codon:yes gene_type:complete